MTAYNREELQESIVSLTSTLHKCEKMQINGRLLASQKTLNDRRVKALRVAVELIEKELAKITSEDACKPDR